ncbi:germinal center-associated signaling and motility protein [Sorex araneus]|uniref:germinal center-associated signaling and motility protein n=1 Tax=Sorex araneus TaxID=42254 RepID=UPI002433D972|nr:germinal center-associated signaling and motility protein [Sorex araneus]
MKNVTEVVNVCTSHCLGSELLLLPLSTLGQSNPTSQSEAALEETRLPAGKISKELASGVSLLRENRFRWQQNTQETPWNMGNQNIKQRTSRCWDGHTAEGCACFPWKKIHIFKGKKNSLRENEEISSARIQTSANRISMEDLCYTVINHSIPRMPAGDSTEGFYENVSPKAVKVLGRMETEYSLLRVTSTPKLTSSPENEYELLGLDRIYSRSLQQPNFL